MLHVRMYCAGETASSTIYIGFIPTEIIPIDRMAHTGDVTSLPQHTHKDIKQSKGYCKLNMQGISLENHKPHCYSLDTTLE